MSNAGHTAGVEGNDSGSLKPELYKRRCPVIVELGLFCIEYKIESGGIPKPFFVQDDATTRLA